MGRGVFQGKRATGENSPRRPPVLPEIEIAEVLLAFLRLRLVEWHLAVRVVGVLGGTVAFVV